MAWPSIACTPLRRTNETSLPVHSTYHALSLVSTLRRVGRDCDLLACSPAASPVRGPSWANSPTDRCEELLNVVDGVDGGGDGVER